MAEALDLDAIRARADAATEGPWVAWPTEPRPHMALGTSGGDPLAVVFERSELAPNAEFLAAAREDIPALIGEVERLRAELERWTSGQRRKSMPTVTAVPDGLQVAAALARSIGTEGGEEHDSLLARAAQTMKALHDAAGCLIAERDAMRARVQHIHRRNEHHPHYCVTCRAPHPCSTIRALDETVEAVDRD